MRCIDFHTHIFPDQLAATTVPALAQAGNVTPASDGTADGLLASMDRAGIEASVICSIATKPSQFAPILDWSRSFRTNRLIPFASLHPDSENLAEEIRQIKTAEIKGIKLHPYYQGFYLNEKRLRFLLELVADQGLIVMLHSGYDIGFPKEERADPAKIKELIKDIPHLKLVAAHLGSWQQWEGVEESLVGENVYLDIAFALEFLERDQAWRILTEHRPDRLLFGSDSPWADQAGVKKLLLDLQLGKDLTEKILGANGAELLGRT
ncbi:MAG: amidohydrolase family protein [Thermodesulfobacteriota bacterium]